MSPNPRLPDIPRTENVTTKWLYAFRERFYVWCAELVVEANARLEGLENYQKQGPDVPSAAAINPGEWGRVQVTGTTNIFRINSRANAAPVTLHFTGALVLKHNQAASGDEKPIMLATGADTATVAGTQVLLQYDTTDSKWYQL